MIVFIFIGLFLVDYLYFGFLSYAFTQNRMKNSFEYIFRCAGIFTYNRQGGLNYFSGSLSKIGFKSNEIVLGITKLSYHKKLSDIKAIEVKSYLLWKCLVIKLGNGETAKVFCDTKQIKELENYLSKFSS
ncbi:MULTISPECIES: hypothetical protein [unclassified Pseudoalteromonas]|uniref:hypothetical protein n=1 Tax=unclassified Pseudoalteromonas TaxID=194690 RepID=UPI0030142D78